MSQWLLVRMLSSLFDHFMTAVHLTEVESVVFNTPYTLVDVTVGNFLRMCLVGMKPFTARQNDQFESIPPTADETQARSRDITARTGQQKECGFSP
ncbi:hypothetical protein EVAR_62638_1 [Eumeta japonica]|uniref:Secreted protein n=1 Tax=Eumeta variegata TaxID=151549 RepID=A0A4C2AHI0_EUMVA|nr:hypothetical protein EVAR_62638_1 [Eumeta japonica]